MQKKIIFLCVLSLMLTLLTACVGADFDVHFIVDGEVYSVVSTSGNETIRLPENPTKEGYEFEGWYWDDGEWEKPFTVNSFLNTPLAASMNVYAKFRHEECSFAQGTVVAPTCTEVGYTVLTCECGESKKTEYVLTTDHTFGEWKTQKDATSTEDGLKARICSACGTIETMTIKYNGNIIFKPTFSTTYRLHCHCCVDHDHCTCCENVYDCLYTIDPSFSVTEMVPSDMDVQFDHVTLNPEDKVYSVTLDALPDDFYVNSDQYMNEIKGKISDYIADDFVIDNININDYKIDIYVKDSSGKDHPVTLPSYPTEPDSPDLEAEDHPVSDPNGSLVP